MLTISECFTEIRLLCDASSTDYSDTDILRRFNAAQEEFGAEIIQSVGKTQFDDINYTTLPTGTITLQDGIRAYTITDRFLDIEQWSVKDIGGTLHVLKRIDPRDYTDTPIEEAFADTGLPTHYDMLENTIKFYPAPSSATTTLTAGATFKYKRTTYTISSAELATGTLVPGIASPWHMTLCKMTALPYCKSYKKDRVAQLERDIALEKAKAKEFYALRGKDLTYALEVNAQDFANAE
jgi:hypothetical protein